MLALLMRLRTIHLSAYASRACGGFYRASTTNSLPAVIRQSKGAGAAVLKLTLGKLWPLLHANGEDVVRLAGVVHDEIILLVAEEHADTWALQLQSVMEECEAKWLGEIPPLGRS
jgi:hypothetical protein